MPEIIEDVKTIRCVRNENGLFDCDIPSATGSRTYENLEGLVLNNGNKKIVIREDNFFDFSSRRRGADVKYFSDEKRLVIDVGE